MFKPKYTITPKLLENIKRIAVLAEGLNQRSFPKVILMEFERRAQSLSVHASTSIEGNPLPLTEVRKILKSQPHHIRDSEREVLNYNAALETLNAQLGDRTLSVKWILEIHKQVVVGLMDRFRCGKLRSEPVFVNDPRVGKPVYLPPDHGDVPKLMTELVDFVKVNMQRLDPIILAGLFHKQFVIIHPFVDGNGRTTRLSTKALLAHMGLDTFKLFSFENYYNQNVTRYFQHVGSFGNYYEIVDDIDFTGWLEYFTDGIIDELLRVEKELKAVISNPDTTLKPYHQKIIAHIKQNGFITDLDYSKLVERAKATRNLDFNKLVDMQLIERMGRGKSTYYRLKNPAFNH